MHQLASTSSSAVSSGGARPAGRSAVCARLPALVAEGQHLPVRRRTVCFVAAPSAPETSEAPAPARVEQLNQHIREGHYETALVNMQASKQDEQQPSIASALLPADPSAVVDVLVVGAGPSGLCLAAELGKRGLAVAVVGHDAPIVNNYGVWLDEFKALGLEHTLECSWPDAVCYFGGDKEVHVGRGYGRVGRRLLREHLLKTCKAAGVKYLNAEVTDIKVVEGGKLSQVTTSAGASLRSRLVTLAAGAAAGRFLQYEADGPVVAAQTAYGIEAEVEGYDEAYPRDLMLFMDFRRHHSGLYESTAPRVQAGQHPNAGDGLWGTQGEAPSFLYAMPLGGKRVFLEETCLVAKPALPFAVLKRRLDRRLKAMGVRVTKVHEEEWSYIPVGGPLPLANQSVTAFGAAANLIHPATGFSVSRSFREAPLVADEVAACIREGLPVAATSQRVWNKLWPQERRAQATFHVFGMELLAKLDLANINAFFNTFFRLPAMYWRGFLASSLSAGQLVQFALITFVLAPWHIKFALIEHLVTDPAGQYLVRAYKNLIDESSSQSSSSSSAMTVSSILLMSQVLAHQVGQSS